MGLDRMGKLLRLPQPDCRGACRRPMKTRIARCVMAGAVTAAALFASVSAVRANTIYVSGYGDATLFTVNSSGSENVLETGLITPEGLTFDALGNLYFLNGPAGNPNQQLIEISTDGSLRTLSTGAYGRGALAYNNGFIYIATHTSVLKMSHDGTTATVASGLAEPRGLARFSHTNCA